MNDEALAPPLPAHLTADAYFGLVDDGVLDADDRVELLEGLVIAKEAQNPWHASGVRWAFDALRATLGTRAVVIAQQPFLAGAASVPEPDVMVVPGTRADYLHRHPSAAHLVVEVSDTTLVQDRLTKAGVYAAAGVPEYWIVSRRGDLVLVSTTPVPADRRYASVRIARRGETVTLAAFPDVTLAVDDLLPPPERA